MGVKVYISGISGNKEVKKRQQRVCMILDSKHIPYDVIDITEPGKESEKEFMQQNSNAKDAKHPLPPQIFNDETYCGDYDEFDLANENDELEKFLKVPASSVNVENGHVANGNTSSREIFIGSRYIRPLKKVQTNPRSPIIPTKLTNFDLKQYSYRNILVISGVPEYENENLEKILYKLASVINCSDFSIATVEYARRFESFGLLTDSRNRSIVVKFIRRFDKEEFLRKFKARKMFTAADLGFVDKVTVLVTEFLTPKNQRLLTIASEIARVKNYHNVWTANCKIFVRKTQGAKAVLVSTVQEVFQL